MANTYVKCAKYGRQIYTSKVNEENINRKTDNATYNYIVYVIDRSFRFNFNPYTIYRL